MDKHRLTKEAQEDRDDFFRLYPWGSGCLCHIMPPCTYCTHPGNPMNQEDDQFWEDIEQQLFLDFGDDDEQ